MKRSVFRAPSVIIILLSITVFAQSNEFYRVNKIDSQIAIDGNLDEAEWATAQPTSNFVILGNDTKAAKTVTWAKMLWDDSNLYVAFFCKDHYIWATYKNRDDQLYKEDVVEVYIDPDGDGQKYLEIEVNPLNTIFDLWLTKPWASGGQGVTGWNMAGLLTAVSIDGTISNNSDNDNGWICEMALPFTAMQFSAPAMNFPPLENETWRFNLYRFDRRSTSGSIGEATGWSQTNGGQHEPDKFGTLYFEGLAGDSVKDEYTSSADKFRLYQNYPNPFNLTTNIQYSLEEFAIVSVSIYNTRGQLVKILVNDSRPAGHYKVQWDGTNSAGERMASDVYFYKLSAHAGTDKFVETRKMLLVK